MRLRTRVIVIAFCACASAQAARPDGHLELGYVPVADVAGTDADGVYVGAQIAGPSPYSFFGGFSFSSLQLDPGPNDYEHAALDLGYRFKPAAAIRLPLSLGYDRYSFAASTVKATSLRLGIDAMLDRRAGLSVYVGHALSADDQTRLDYGVNDFGAAASLYFARQFGVFVRYRQTRFNPDGAGANFDISETIAGIKATF